LAGKSLLRQTPFADSGPAVDVNLKTIFQLSFVSNGGIRLGINYSVLNKTK
jgi:hypothetical protein